jgi:hypothetical protein
LQVTFELRALARIELTVEPVLQAIVPVQIVL